MMRGTVLRHQDRDSYRQAFNVCRFLTWLNIIRTGNMNPAEDSLHNVEQMLYDIKAMIVRDKNMAATVFIQLGVPRVFCQVAHPKTFQPFEQFNFTGNTEQLTPGHVDLIIWKHFFNIFWNLTNPSNGELDDAILMNSACFTLRCMTTVSYSDFVDASVDVDGVQFIGRAFL